MRKGISYEKIHRDYLKSKGEYPFKGSVDYFNEEEIELIKKYGYWFTGLCSGELPLITPQQREFKKLYDKIYSVIKEYPPKTTKWWKSLTIKQKTWVKYVRFLEKEKQKNLTHELEVNVLFKEVYEKENKHFSNSYELTFDLKYYFKEIIGLTDDDKEIINQNIEYWITLFDKPHSELNEREKILLDSLDDEIGSSVKIDSVFHYFFRQIKELNLKDITLYKVTGDTWYSNEMYKQNKKMMFSVTSINHKK